MSIAPELQQIVNGMRVFTIVTGALMVVASGAAAWTVLRATVRTMATDVSDVKKALGLKPVEGRIRAAFVTHDECRVLERRSDDWQGAAGEQLADHEHRITVLEATHQSPRPAGT